MAIRSVTETQWVLAPAKLNLFLELLRRRSDGYHDLETVMVAVDVCDSVQVTRRSRGASRLCVQWQVGEGRFRQQLGAQACDQAWRLPDVQSNLAWLALQGMIKEFALADAFDISILKRIPMGAGMGGASADAAGVLLALARMHEIDPLSQPLWDLAGRLGSDVPFQLAACAGAMSACIARGRGELLEGIQVRHDLHFVICYPPHPLSTAKVYASAVVGELCQSSQGIVAALQGTSVAAIEQGILNRLQEPAQQLQPQITERMRWLGRLGTRGAWVTGSGAACYGLGRSRLHAVRVARQLASRGCGLAMVARPLSREIQQEHAA